MLFIFVNGVQCTRFSKKVLIPLVRWMLNYLHIIFQKCPPFPRLDIGVGEINFRKWPLLVLHLCGSLRSVEVKLFVENNFPLLFLKCPLFMLSSYLKIIFDCFSKQVLSSCCLCPSIWCWMSSYLKIIFDCLSKKIVSLCCLYPSMWCRMPSYSKIILDCFSKNVLSSYCLYRSIRWWMPSYLKIIFL